jgi:hypothetical protein
MAKRNQQTAHRICDGGQVYSLCIETISYETEIEDRRWSALNSNNLKDFDGWGR